MNRDTSLHTAVTWSWHEHGGGVTQCTLIARINTG